ncbi:hypothetical protein [Moorena producens]|uniref:hypothetical protein n=1 Tax=Moorena producens TaxID=1155739 RepID=UPI0013BE0EEC|nr:hypothetical protein [Moorena sp. SIO2I5]
MKQTGGRVCGEGRRSFRSVLTTTIDNNDRQTSAMLLIVYYSIQDFRANIPCSLFPVPYSLFPIPDSRLPTPDY